MTRTRAVGPSHTNGDEELNVVKFIKEKQVTIGSSSRKESTLQSTPAFTSTSPKRRRRCVDADGGKKVNDNGDEDEDEDEDEGSGFTAWRALPLLAVVLVGLVVRFYGLGDQFNLESLGRRHDELVLYCIQHPVTSPIIYAAMYCLLVSCSMPGATLMTLSGGLLFVQPVATFSAVIGASSGASILFLVARSSVGSALRARLSRKSGLVRKIDRWLGDEVVVGGGSRPDGPWNKPQTFVTLMLLRLIPIFPFWFINLAPSLFERVDFLTFALATAVAIIPGCYCYTSIGNLLGDILAQSGPGLENPDVPLSSSSVYSLELDGGHTSFVLKSLMSERMLRPVLIVIVWAGVLVGTRYYLARSRSRAKSKGHDRSIERD